MGTIFKKKKKWFIDYYEPNGKRVRKSVSKYKETALLVLKKVEIDIAEEKYLDVVKHDPIPFKDFAKKFRHRHIHRRNKGIKHQEYLLGSLIKHFGKKAMHEITTDDIEAYLTRIEQNRSAGTFNKHLTLIKSLFNRANEWDDLRGHYPAKSIKKLPEDNERCRYLTEEEQERLLTVCSGVLKLAVLFSFRSGLRRNELMNLKWSQTPNSNYVDLKNNTIFVHESLSKSKKSRYVPLAPSVKQALMDFPQQDESGYIFANPKTGKPYVTFKKSFKTALLEANIHDFKWHDGRHQFASDLVRKGVDLFVVQKLMGHSSPKMTQRYAHLRDDHLTEAIHSLDEEKSKNFDFGHYMDTTVAPVVIND